jgi:hypothetical protein
MIKVPDRNFIRRYKAMILSEELKSDTFSVFSPL